MNTDGDDNYDDEDPGGWATPDWTPWRRWAEDQGLVEVVPTLNARQHNARCGGTDAAQNNDDSIPNHDGTHHSAEAQAPCNDADDTTTNTTNNCTILQVATDCSGLDTSMLALRQMNIPHDHLFSSDISGYVRRHLRSNVGTNVRIYKDLLERDNNKVGSADLYIAGFPCQPFSSSNHSRRGLQDPRGTVFGGCVNYISRHLPKAFVLENVKGANHDKQRQRLSLRYQRITQHRRTTCSIPHSP